MTFVDRKDLFTRRFRKCLLRRDVNKFLDRVFANLPNCDVGVHISFEYQVSTDGEDVKK